VRVNATDEVSSFSTTFEVVVGGVCVPNTTCNAKQCGWMSDGCGGSVDCGTCSAGCRAPLRDCGGYCARICT
jgi:hypothetical protein